MIYVFGDSFSVSRTMHDPNINKTAWTDILSKKLNSKIEIHADFGVSNEWILYQYYNQSSKIQPGDIVIIQTTASNRRWFFKDRPYESNYIMSMYNSKELTKEEKTAIKNYVSYLYNEEQNNLIYTAFLYTFLYIANMNREKNIPTIILPGFHGSPEVIGNLNDSICNKEFKNVDIQKKFYGKTGFDPRINHISEENRYILADKLYNNIVNKTPIDLTTNFKTNIYN
jgi:hypothetical protein